MIATLPPAISQVGYPGAGDVDDCWAVASIWAAHAADPSIKLPTIPEFRAAAHNPDLPGPTGGTLAQIVHASVALWPDLPVTAYSSLDWSGFAAKVKAGSVASLAVLSSRLPAYLRFGFMGAHQVGVIWRDGALFVMNPLAADGDSPLKITEPALEYAARGLGGWIQAALYQPVAGDAMLTLPEGVTSPQRVRIVKKGDLTDEAGVRVASVPVGRTYPYLGTKPGHKAVLVRTALPYPDGRERPTQLFVASDMAAIEDVPPGSPVTSNDPVTVTLTVKGADVYSATF